MTPRSRAAEVGRSGRTPVARSLVARTVGLLRGRRLLAVDLPGLVAAAYLALALRYEEVIGPDKLMPLAPVLLILLSARIASNMRLGLYSRRWRSASVPDLERIVAAAVLGSVVAVVTVYGATAVFGATWMTGFPRSFWPVEMLLSIAVLGGVRFGIRAASELAPRSSVLGANGTNGKHATLLYGAGQTGVLMARSARRSPEAGVVPVGFLDDDPDLAGGVVADLRVFGGLEALDTAIARTRAEALLITMPSAPGKAVRQVVDAAMARGLTVRTVPAMEDLLDGDLDAYRIRRVQVADLLRRTTGSEHAAAVYELIRDRTVLITGAGGSIGSELARQVFQLRPRRLILVDRAESALYIIQRELEAKRSRDDGAPLLLTHLANVASRSAVDRLISTERPDIIFHAAAYKHVPMLEDHPSEAVQVNIGGTRALLDASVAAGVQHFILVSTDKAVRPSSVMGATKRVAEMLVAEAARRTGRSYLSVRFGNVLGSNGSVVPIFQDQLEKGEALTITHPEMSRYFMTIPEAAWLIVDAAALGATGDVFVLDMGEPIRILDLARDLVRLSGRDPDAQPMDIVGLRPGEKLHEELFYEGEHVAPTSVDRVLRAATQPHPAHIRYDVHDLLAMATGEHEDELRTALLEYVRRTAETPVAEPAEGARAAAVAVPIDVGDRSAQVSVAGIGGMTP